VLLFAGGRGATRIWPGGRIGRLAGNFLINSRALFRAQMLTTLVFGSRSDETDDLRWIWDSVDSAADIGAVIAHLRGVLGVPVWPVGTSRGTVSVQCRDPARGATRGRCRFQCHTVLPRALFERLRL